MTQYEREEAQLEQDLASGRITHAEFNRQIQQMERDYRSEARESAERAYDNELNNW